MQANDLLAKFEQSRPFERLEAERLQQLLAELSRRKQESLHLYRPLPVQEAFHACASKERLIYGSNRSGKTVAVATEVARAVTGQDPYNKYPQRDGSCICIGAKGRHIAKIMWPKLYRAGAIKMIRDLHTREWRSFQPWNLEDVARAADVKKAPPLIPARFIESIAWENKKEDQPSVVNLKTGWQLIWCSSEGKPLQGIDVDLVWLDEEIIESTWYDEMFARTLDRKGRLIWSATPHAATEQLYDLHTRAEDAHAHGEKTIAEFFCSIYQNPHVDENEKRIWEKSLVNKDEVARVRIGGEWAIEGLKVLPEFYRKIHLIKPFPVPHHWTRYLHVDPGSIVCAVLFAAVPPPSEGDQVVLFEELYIRSCNAHKFAEEVARKADGQIFEAFLIDPRSARQHEIGIGQTIQEQYARELAAQRVTSLGTGSNFLWGTEDVNGSIEAARGWLRVRNQGTPKVVAFENLEHFVWEIERWHKVRCAGIITEKPVKKHDHLMDCFRSLAAHGCPYVKFKARARGQRGALRTLEAKRKRAKARAGGEEPFVQLGSPLTQTVYSS